MIPLPGDSMIVGIDRSFFFFHESGLPGARPVAKHVVSSVFIPPPPLHLSLSLSSLLLSVASRCFAFHYSHE